MRQLKIFIYFLITTFILTLTACSSMYKDNPSLHKSNVQNTRPLVIPEGLNNEKTEDYYPVPQLEKQPPAIPVSIVPPGSTLARQVGAIQK
jgi:uncharacterized lipoprotein